MIFRSLVCLGLLCLGATALWVGQREFEAYLFSALAPGQAFATLSQEDAVPVPLSVRGRRGVMIGCLDALYPGAMRFQAAQDIARVAEHCDAMAEQVLTTSPTLSAAHLVQMEARFARGDVPGAVAALDRSGQTARRAMWISLRRLQMVRALPEVHRQSVQDTLRLDVALLFESAEGRDVLAQFYGFDEAFRPVILSVAQTRPAGEQASFLDLTRGVFLEEL